MPQHPCRGPPDPSTRLTLEIEETCSPHPRHPSLLGKLGLKGPPCCGHQSSGDSHGKVRLIFSEGVGVSPAPWMFTMHYTLMRLLRNQPPQPEPHQGLRRSASPGLPNIVFSCGQQAVCVCTWCHYSSPSQKHRSGGTQPRQEVWSSVRLRGSSTSPSTHRSLPGTGTTPQRDGPLLPALPHVHRDPVTVACTHHPALKTHPGTGDMGHVVN